MVKYRYDEGGNRIEKIKGGVTERYIRDHTGREMALHSSTEGYEYFNLFGNGSIGRVDVGSRDAIWIDPETNEEIMVKLRVDSRRYYVQDHLGSNRVTIDTTGTVLNAQDYYAFGEILRSYNNSSPNERYDFTGKERDTESGLNYHGARYYDSELGRWLNVDPLADKYPGWSSYNYCLNNPVNSIDPDGMLVAKPNNSHITAAIRLAYRTSSTYREGHNAVLNNSNQLWTFKSGNSLRSRATTHSVYTPSGRAVTTTSISLKQGDGVFPTSGSKAVKTMANEVTHANKQSKLKNSDEQKQFYSTDGGKGIAQGTGTCTEEALNNENQAGEEYYTDTDEDTKYQEISDDELDSVIFSSGSDTNSYYNEVNNEKEDDGLLLELYEINEDALVYANFKIKCSHPITGRIQDYDVSTNLLAFSIDNGYAENEVFLVTLEEAS
ncbi:MAG: RHS repeat-associated core domain-containing protein [Ignavibacteriales bacterium]|nr:RHS repeat-associated core domain-containing protein [Ignavibacteriales bacterium]